MSDNSGAIHDKVIAASLGAAVSQIVVWIVESSAHTDMPTAIEGALTTLFVFGLGYFVPERKGATA